MVACFPPRENQEKVAGSSPAAVGMCNFLWKLFTAFISSVYSLFLIDSLCSIQDAFIYIPVVGLFWGKQYHDIKKPVATSHKHVDTIYINI
jgi:hypothetical protein